MFEGEILSKKTDIFALGSILYTMLSGFYPLSTNNVNEYILKMRTRKNLNFNHKDIWSVSLDCKGLIMELMHDEAESRPDTRAIINSKWLKPLMDYYSPKGNSINLRLFDKYIQKMKDCVHLNLLERVVLKTIARKAKYINKQELGYMFNVFDTTHRNMFDRAEFKAVLATLYPNSTVMTCLDAFTAIDVSKNGLIE